MGHNIESKEELENIDNVEIIDYNIDEGLGENEQLERLYKDVPNNGSDKQKNIIKETISWVKMLLIAGIIAFFVTQVVIINATVPTGSMESTIGTGSRIMGLRLAYLFNDPERFDIVVFKFYLEGRDKGNTDTETNYVKRIIGLPGETVKIENSQITIYDGDELVTGPLDESEYFDETWTYKPGPYSFTVPEDSYFVLGDNRNFSADTRDWYDKLYLNGKCEYEELFIKKEDIIGKVYFTYYPGFKWIDK